MGKAAGTHQHRCGMSVDGVWSRPQRLLRVASQGEGGRGAINESVKTRKQPSSASPPPRRIASRRFASVHVSRLALFGRLSLGTEWNVGLMMLCIGHLAILVISRVSFTRYDTSVLRQLCVTTTYRDRSTMGTLVKPVDRVIFGSKYGCLLETTAAVVYYSLVTVSVRGAA